MSESFWGTIWQPGVRGNPWALAALFASQAFLCWGFYKKQHVGMAIFFSAIASSNLTRLVEGWKL